MNEDIYLEGMLNEWMVGTIFASFEFSAGFVLKFERIKATPPKPQVFYLDIKADSYIGDRKEWENFVKSLPIKEYGTEENKPAFAYRLMFLLGAEMLGVNLKNDGTIILNIKDDDFITVNGRDDVWDESWSLYESRDLAGEDARCIVCDSEGKIFDS